MTDKNLLQRARHLNFPLFEVEEAQDANLTLADVVRSKDLRLWEGFPVMLASSAENGLFNRGKTYEYLKKPFDRALLASLVAMSLALYRNLGAQFLWANSLLNTLNAKEKKVYQSFLAAYDKNGDLKVGGHAMSAERLKTSFNNYFIRKTESLRSLLSAKEDMGLEYALSQVFSPKQKELFLKKLRGEGLTKTEKEYFSRVVKKKAMALANADLHRLSRKVLGE